MLAPTGVAAAKNAAMATSVLPLPRGSSQKISKITAGITIRRMATHPQARLVQQLPPGELGKVGAHEDHGNRRVHAGDIAQGGGDDLRYGRELKNSATPMTMPMTTGFLATFRAEMASRRSAMMYTP